MSGKCVVALATGDDIGVTKFIYRALTVSSLFWFGR